VGLEQDQLSYLKEKAAAPVKKIEITTVGDPPR
jgi:hypothetical protein